MSRDPLHDYQEYLREDHRRRRNEALAAWTVLILAAIGVALVAWIMIGFVLAILAPVPA